MLPFEPAFSITLGQLIVWYMLLAFCSTLGVLGAISYSRTVTGIRLIIGALLGAGGYYAFSWLFQSKASMEFAHIFNTVIN